MRNHSIAPDRPALFNTGHSLRMTQGKFWQVLFVCMLVLSSLLPQAVQANSVTTAPDTPDTPPSTHRLFLPLANNPQQTSKRRLQYQVGHTYSYQWDLNIQTQSISRDSQGVQEGGNTSQIKGMVDVQILDQEVDGTYLATVAIHNLSIVTSSHDEAATLLQDTELTTALSKPLLFKQAATGEIREVRYPQDAPATALEMQKGIVNALQVSLQTDNQYTVEEEGGQGRYQAHYKLAEEAVGLQIVKQINADDFLEMVSAGANEAKIQLQNRVEMILDQVPQSVHVVEEIMAGGDQTDLANGDNTTQVTIETKVLSDGWLRLAHIQATTNDMVTAAATTYVQGSLRADLRDFAASEIEIDLATIDLAAELQTLEQNPTNPAFVQRVADLVRQDETEQALKAVQERLLTTTNEQVAGSYIDVLGIAGTNGAQIVLADTVLAAMSVRNDLKARGLTQVIDLKHPSMYLVNVVTALSQSAEPTLRSLAVLTLGGLADSLQTSNSQAANRIAMALAERLAQSTSAEETELFLLALGNTGLPATQKWAAAYLTNPNPTVRGAATLALRKLPVEMAEKLLIDGLYHDESGYVQEMAATALAHRLLRSDLRTLATEEALQAYAAVTAAAVDGVWTRNWDKTFSAGPITINLPGDITVKSAPDAPALTLETNQKATGSVMGIGFSLFHAKLLSDVPSGSRRFGAYFWIGANTLVWQYETTVGCTFSKSGTLWEGSKQFFTFSKSIPVYWILTVTLNAQATGYAKVTYEYQHQLCAEGSASATGKITPQAWVSGSGSAYLALALVRGGVTLATDILKTSIPAQLSAILTQSGGNPPALSACVDIRATVEPLSGKLAATAQVWVPFKWKNIGTWNIWSFAVNSQNYNLWVQCWP